MNTNIRWASQQHIGSTTRKLVLMILAGIADDAGAGVLDYQDVATAAELDVAGAHIVIEDLAACSLVCVGPVRLDGSRPVRPFSLPDAVRRLREAARDLAAQIPRQNAPGRAVGRASVPTRTNSREYTGLDYDRSLTDADDPAAQPPAVSADIFGVSLTGRAARG